MDKKRSNGAFYHRIKAILLGVLLGEAVTILILLAASLLMLKMDLPLFLTDIWIVCSAAAGGFASGYLCARIAREKGIVLGAVCGGIQILILLLFSLGAEPSTTLPLLLLKFGLLLAGAMAGGILGVNRKGKRIKY